VPAISAARRGLIALLLPAALGAPAAARAETGTVVMRVPGCSYYVVSAPPAFVLLKWFGGYDPPPGAPVAGALGSFGMTTVTGPGGMQGSAWIEDTLMDGNAAARKMFERCALGGR